MMDLDAAPGESPLTGVIICCTSLDRDTQESIHKTAQSLGAECNAELSIESTHLVVGAITSVKYNWVAKEWPHIKVVFPEFIEAVREIWLKGEEADIPALEEKYKVPALFGLKICITGFEDVAMRKHLGTTISSNGAEYHEDLTKQVTHLIVNKPVGRKYMYALNWKIKTVGEEWLNDSIERGMRLNEALYDPNTAPEERGKGAWVRSLPDSLMAQLKRLRDDSGKKIASRPAKIRRTMSNRQNSDVQALWADMRAVATSTKASQLRDAWEDNQENQDDESTSNAVQEATTLLQPETTLRATGPETVFSGLTIYTHGFNKDRFAILEKHITSHGGVVLDTADFVLPNSIINPSTSYLMFPSDREKKVYGTYPTELDKATKVNEWWVVTCLVNKRLVSPRENRFCNYFHAGKIPGFEKLTICSTGFSGPDLLHLKRTTELLGAKYDEYLTEKASVLICGTKSSLEKLKHAKSHNLPTISVDWLWSCVDFGFVVGFDSHPYKRSKGGVSSQPSHERPQIKDLKAGEWQPDEALVTSKRPSTIESRTKDLKFKNVRPLPNDEKVVEPHTEIDNSVPNDSENSGTMMLAEEEESHPLREAAPSRLNSPNKSASGSGNDESVKKSDITGISEEVKERTMGLAAMLESRIATRSQSDVASQSSLTKKRKMKFLGRGAPVGSRNNSLDESNYETSKMLDTNEETQEMLASQKLEYEDQAMKNKRAKFKAALTEEPAAVPEVTAEPDAKVTGRTRRRRL